MRKKIFRSLLLIAVIVLLLSSAISTSYLFNYFNDEQVKRLSNEIEFASDAVNELGTDYLENLETDTYRFTVVAANGEVIFDSQANVAEMENHADREEIIEAFENGKGSSARYSATLTQRTFYEAVKLDNGSVLRISIDQLSIGGAFLVTLPMNLLIAIIAVAFALLLSNRMAKRITAPLMALDLDHPADNNSYEELSPILSKIHRQHKQLKEQTDELRYKNEEFSQIISSMNEGLVLLNEQGSVVAMNKSAKAIFTVKGDAVGKDFHLLDRTPELRTALQTVKTDTHTEVSITKDGRQYQFNISLIENDGNTVGTLILAFDITDKAFAERNRQEFTANVSHELKTPLQSIIGSAELLENGLVKPEDNSRFVGNIRKEATRLVSLIDDIIRLSQLDEKAELEKENVNLYVMAREVKEVLTSSAAKKNVEINLEGEDVIVNGVRRYLYEIIYNLCDNAIRYNKEGGSVAVSIKTQGKGAVITVADTGIGIPAEHQARIFERFYRVDKSHSKETGGTGLGLSIVKRAVMLHGGKLKLDSKQGKGTTVTVKLP